MEHVSPLFSSTKAIFMLSLVASLGKYALRIQNLYLFIDCSIENGIVVVYCKGGVWLHRFHNSSHLGKQVSNSFAVTGGQGRHL